MNGTDVKVGALLLQIPKCRQRLFSDQTGAGEGTAFLLPKAQVPVEGWRQLANHLDRPLAKSMSLPYGEAQSDPMSLHHPLHIHLS